jgi:hypothetical protein
MCKLLTSGIIAGPLFLAVWLVQALTREGFDPRRHPISLLSLGDWGFVQIANFMVTGVLFVLTAIGLRRALGTGKASTWGPRLIALHGIGLVIAGVFKTDPGAGFPSGAPLGAPEAHSLSAGLHELGFAIAQLSWLAACFVFCRRFAADGERSWKLACVAAAVGALVTAAFPDIDSLSLRLVAATAIEFAFLAALAARYSRAHEALERNVATRPIPVDDR